MCPPTIPTVEKSPALRDGRGFQDMPTRDSRKALPFLRTKAIRGAEIGSAGRKESPAEAGQVHPGRKIKMKRNNTNSKSRLF